MNASNKRTLEKATKIELENFAAINAIIRERFEEERAALNGGSPEAAPRVKPRNAPRKVSSQARRIAVSLRSSA